MGIVHDTFNRANLGPNWESPARLIIRDDGALAMISGVAGVEMTPIDVNDENCSGIYIGQSFPTEQFVEVTIINDIEYDTQVAYDANYAVIRVLLNFQKRETGSRGIIFSLYPQLYYTSYDELVWGLAEYGGADTRIATTGGYLQTPVLFTSERIPAGTILRAIRIGNVCTASIYSPDYEQWIELGTLDILEATDGYPGISLYTTDSADDARVSDFRAGNSLEYKSALIKGTSHLCTKSITKSISN